MPDQDAVATQIVDAARQHFLRSGYSQVSTEAIASSVGRSKKTLYKHFATKEALLRAVLSRVDAEAERAIAGLDGGEGSARLRQAIATVAVHLTTTHRILFADLRASDPALGEQAWRERREAMARILQPVLEAAVADGSVRSDLSIEQTLTIILGCIEGLAAPTDTPDERLAALAGLLVDGLRRR